MLLLLDEGNPPNLIDHSEDLSAYFTVSLDERLNIFVDPLGLITADKASATGNALIIHGASSLVANVVYTGSFYAKKVSGSDIVFDIAIKDASNVIIGVPKEITITESWQRFSISLNIEDNTQVNIWIGDGNTWTSGMDIYIWGLQLNLGYLSDYKKTGTSAVGILLSKTDNMNNLADFLPGVGEIRTVDESDDMLNLADAVAKSLDVA